MDTLSLALEQSRKFDKELEKLTKILFKEIDDLVKNTFDIKMGILPGNEYNLSRLSTFYNEVEATINSSGYLDLTSKAFNENQILVDSRFKELAKSYKKKQLQTINLSKINTLSKMQIQSFGNVPDNVLFKIKDLLSRNINLGVSLDILSKELELSLTKELLNYSKSYMATAKNQFTQVLENTLAEELGFDKSGYLWRYFGDPLVDKSHLECIWALEQKENAPYFTEQERQDFEAGILPSDLKRSSIRYNCHHNFRMSSIKLSDL